MNFEVLGGSKNENSSNRSISTNRTSSKNAGTWRDLVFDPNSKILGFFLHLGEGLSVLKCVLKSDNFYQIWGTLLTVNGVLHKIQERKMVTNVIH